MSLLVFMHSPHFHPYIFHPQSFPLQTFLGFAVDKNITSFQLSKVWLGLSSSQVKTVRPAKF